MAVRPSLDLICEQCGKPFRGRMIKGRALCRPHYYDTLDGYREKRKEWSNTDQARAKRRALNAKKIKPCETDACTGTARNGSAYCSPCISVKHTANRLCVGCGKSYRGNLYLGHPVCVSCRQDESGRRTRSEAWHRRRARQSSSLQVETYLSWRALWALGIRHCAYCGIECNPDDKLYGHVGPTHPTLDHVVPLVLGGAHTRSNGVLACFKCNTKKGSKPLEQMTEGTT